MTPRSAVPPAAAVLYCCLLLINMSNSTYGATTPEPELTFAENVYVKLSGACRALVDLRYTSSKGQEDVVKSIKIVQLDDNVIRTYPINEAFTSLTSNAVFDITKQTKIVIHGFNDNSQSQVPFDLAKAYNEKKMFNVLIVDAEQSLNKWYPLSVHNARLVAKRLANLLANLENYGASAEDFHILGISLGAHIAGWVGKYFRLYKGRKLGRITGLDPAGPCFTHAYSDQRLDRLDANYVDVVHSNRLVQGVIEPLGHADYYLNGGGPNQPGCFSPTCSHLRASQVYTESIREPKSIVGIKCSDWNNFLKNSCRNEYSVLGYGSSTKSRGLFYLRTAPGSPYGMGMDGTRNENNIVKSLPWMESFNLIK